MNKRIVLHNTSFGRLGSKELEVIKMLRKEEKKQNLVYVVLSILSLFLTGFFLG